MKAIVKVSKRSYLSKYNGFAFEVDMVDYERFQKSGKFIPLIIKDNTELHKIRTVDFLKKEVILIK